MEQASIYEHGELDGTIWRYEVHHDRKRQMLSASTGEREGASSAPFATLVGCVTGRREVEVPDMLDGFPVRHIASDALAKLGAVEKIVCPDSIVEIGNCAFRRNPALKEIVFPRLVESFSASWLRECPLVEEVVLPGGLSKLGSAVFESKGLKRLHIGSAVREIDQGAFERSRLEAISVSPDNSHIMTDGTALYSIDQLILIALACPVKRYDVYDGCQVIARKAFYGMKAVKEVRLPESVRTIEPFAFAHSGITTFHAPSCLSMIDEKAFYHCSSLTTAHLNGSIQSIGDEAFASSALSGLEIPASTEYLGRSIASRTNVVYAGDAATFKVSTESKRFLIDESGGLYRREDDGLHLVQLLDENVRSYIAIVGTVAVDDRSCAFHDALEEAILPDGVVEVGASAFRVCRNLRRVRMPDTVRSIGKEAFIDTMLESFEVPVALESLGENALVTMGAHHEGVPPSLRDVSVREGNDRFFMSSGMLCERLENATRVIVFTNSVSRVAFPPDAEEVAPYAFNNAYGIEDLHLNARLRSIGACGLGVWCWIRHIRIDVEKPIEGRSSFDLYFPETSRSVHGFLVAIGMSSQIYMPTVMAQYDNCIVTARDYHSPNNPENIGAYEQISLILDRLSDPVLLSRESRERYERLVEANIEGICVDIARHDDREAIDKMLELGCLNEDNLEGVIKAVGALQDAAMTGYLLEVKRRRFGQKALDFDL